MYGLAIKKYLEEHGYEAESKAIKERLANE